MSRHYNNDIPMPWKISLPATLAGKVEFTLLDPIHNKPIYASRNKLIVSLLEWWLARERGEDHLPHVPSITELRARKL